MTVDRSTNWASNLLHPDRATTQHRDRATPATPSAPPDKQALARALLAKRLERRSRFSEPDKAKIFGRFLQGENVEEIGASFGVSGMAIRKLVDAAITEGGLEPPKRKKRKP
jgi:DNA-directed RNA polymerase specialized sigma subunit